MAHMLQTGGSRILDPPGRMYENHRDPCDSQLRVMICANRALVFASSWLEIMVASFIWTFIPVS